MADMQFGIILTVFGGGLTMVSLGLIVVSIRLMAVIQRRSLKSEENC